MKGIFAITKDPPSLGASTPRPASPGLRKGARATYANAAQILPPTLLRAVRKHATGLLWVPAASRCLDKTRGLRRRDAEIRLARRQGARLREIARRFHRSVTRVCEICRGVRALRRSAQRRARRAS